jgi:hypothetical protein
MPHPEIPAEALRKEQELAEAEPDVNPWACIIVLVITVALMGVTAEFVRFTRLPTHAGRYLISPRSSSTV